MKLRTPLVRSLGILMLALFAAHCGGGGGEDSPVYIPPAPAPDPFAGYVPDPEIYAAVPDPARIISVSAVLIGAPDIQFPVDQIILLMEIDTPRANVELLAGTLGGRIVGQVPSQDFYQLEVPAETRAELDALIALAEADPDVAEASYNLLGLPMQCPPENDIQDHLYLDEERCPFMDIGYYNAITIFDHVRPELSLNDVWVAVVDTGIQQDNGEFDDVYMLDLGSPDTSATDFDGHGTAVASLIAADNDGAGINGIASRFLGSHLMMLNAGSPSQGFADYFAAAERAMPFQPNVVNLSLGWAHYNTGIDLAAIRASWERMFRNNPNSLFACAADNERYDLTATNYAPGGIILPNVITVGGTNLCAPDEAWASSATGPRVNIAAPARGVPTAAWHDGHAIEASNGNSVATPLVVSLAAILKSIDPTLSPRQIRDNYLTRYGLPTDLSVSGILMNMPIAIEQLLVERGADTPASVRNLIDSDGNDRYDPPSMVINRICGGLQYSVTGYGSWDYSQDELERPDMVISGTLAPDAWTLTANVPWESYILMGCIAGCSFELDRPYLVSEDYDTIPGTVGMSWVLRPEEPWTTIGSGLSGAVVFDSCRVDERFGLTNEPISINVTGSFDAGLEVVEADSSLHYTDAEGWFSIPFINPGIGGAEPTPLSVYIEENCEGGYPAR